MSGIIYRTFLSSRTPKQEHSPCVFEKNFACLILVALSVALGTMSRVAHGAEQEVVLVVRGEAGRETAMSSSALAKLPCVSGGAKDEKGREPVWEGTPLYEVLRATGTKFGEALRGSVLSSFLLVEAADGYRVVFTFPEIDPAFTDLMFLLADRRDGQPLGEYEDRLRIRVPHEKHHARWVRRVVAVSIRRP